MSWQTKRRPRIIHFSKFKKPSGTLAQRNLTRGPNRQNNKLQAATSSAQANAQLATLPHHHKRSRRNLPHAFSVSRQASRTSLGQLHTWSRSHGTGVECLRTLRTLSKRCESTSCSSLSLSETEFREHGWIRDPFMTQLRLRCRNDRSSKLSLRMLMHPMRTAENRLHTVLNKSSSMPPKIVS